MSFQEKLEKNIWGLIVMVAIVVSVGGIVEIVPLFYLDNTIEKLNKDEDSIRPYSALELEGRDVYIREGCYLCHSQMIRPFRDEKERYGHYSLAAESMYDHPFQWGSKRTGPDLARVGGKYSDEWHRQHLIHPQDVVPESIMPSYSGLINTGADFRNIADHLQALRITGVPYSDDMIAHAYDDAVAQAMDENDNQEGLVSRYGDKVQIRDFDGQKEFISEMDALIAYLQVLGTMAELKDYDLDLDRKETGK